MQSWVIEKPAVTQVKNSNLLRATYLVRQVMKTLLNNGKKVKMITAYTLTYQQQLQKKLLLPVQLVPFPE